MNETKIWLFDFYGVLCHPKDGDPSEPYNQKLIEWLRDKTSSQTMHIFTSGSVSNDAQKEFSNQLFDSILYAHRLGLPKSLPSTYTRITVMLKVDPQEIFFVDDTEKNIEAAQSIGVQAFLFDTTPSLIAQLDHLL